MPSDPLRVVIIGGGGTGAALAHDLTLRGFKVLLFEKGELTSGTTGRHHGMLHSGARYAVGDTEVARECMEECCILSRITRDVIEENYGIFVAQNDEECAYAEQFLPACAEAGIPTRRLSADEVLRIEPRVTPAVRMGVLVPDGVVDAWRMPLQFFASAQAGGADIRRFTSVVDVVIRDRRVTAVKTYHHLSATEDTVSCDMLINASGAWAGQTAEMFGATLPVTLGPGTLLAVRGRLLNTVLQRLAPPGDGDIILPQRELTVAGTTNTETEQVLDMYEAPAEEVQFLLARGDDLLPGLSEAPLHAAWIAVRPLVSDAFQHARGLSRKDICVDHYVEDGIEAAVSIIGGKATTLRAMAEKTADLVCAKLGVDAICTTKEQALLSHRMYRHNQR